MASEKIIAWNNTTGWQNWSISDFVAWHRGLVKQFGNQKDSKGNYLTDKYWVIFWVASEGTTQSKLKQLIIAPSQFKDEIEYLQKYPVIYNLSGAETAVKFQKLNPIDLTINGVESVFGGINNIIDGFSFTTKVLKYAIPALITAIIIIAIIYVYKTFAK